jgi:hypothetical protein
MLQIVANNRCLERYFYKMLRLITKLPEEKDPVIAICFESEIEARNTNADLVAKFSKAVYQIRFMPTEGLRMNIMIISDQQQRLYKDVYYDEGKFFWWLDYTEKRRSYSFCHVIENAGQIKVVRIIEGNKSFVLKANAYILVNSERLNMM